MKRILFLLVVIMSFYTSAFAITVSELHNSPQFVQVTTRDNEEYYVDKNTINTLRYAPPFYTIEYTQYIVSFTREKILVIHSVADYNYNRSIDYLLKNILSGEAGKIKNNGEIVNKQLISQKFQDNGLTVRAVESYIYDFNGNVTAHNTNPWVMKSPFAGPTYNIAAHVFTTVYDIAF